MQRIWGGEIGGARAIESEDRVVAGGGKKTRPGLRDGPVLALGEEERGAVADILRRVARANYLEVGEIKLEVRPGEISMRARVYEPEEEYE